MQKDKIPSRNAESLPAETFRWLFGIVDRDLKTVLLPFEYDEEPKIDIGNKVYSWVPHWIDGYMILKKGGKCGVIDFTLREPPIQKERNAAYSFWKVEEKFQTVV